MKLFLDLKNRRFVKSAASNVALDRLILKRRDTLPIEVVYVENGATATPPAGTTAAVGLKAKFSDSNFLAFAAPGETTLVLNTIPVEAAFSSNPASISALLEIRWGAPGTAHRTATLAVELQNAVITGDEGTPAAIPDGKASQAEAEAGTDNAKWMTPLRTAQAIEALAEPAYFGTTQPPAGSNYKFWVNTSTGRQFALIGGQWLETSGSSTGDLGGTGGGGVTSYNDLTDKPTLGTAAATAASNYATAAQGAKADSASQPGHTHSIADTTGLQAALDAKQPSGSYAPATGIAPTAITGTAVITTDSRLSDSRAPLSHQHAIADVTDLSTSLASKISGTGVASMQVVAALPASPAATTFYIVIPSGATTASAVTLGNVSLLTGGGSGGGGGGSTFTPSSITGLQLWLDASDEATLLDASGNAVAANSPVARWKDKSSAGNDFVQSVVNNQPTRATFNGLETLAFDGANDGMSTAWDYFFTNISLFIVFRSTAIQYNRFFTLNDNSGAFDYSLSGNIIPLVGNSSGSIGAYVANTSSYAAVVPYSANTLAIAGSFITTTSITTKINAASATEAVSFSGKTLKKAQIGVINSFSDSINGNIAEVLFYNTELTSSQIQQVQSYLSTKWGISL